MKPSRKETHSTIIPAVFATGDDAHADIQAALRALHRSAEQGDSKSAILLVQSALESVAHVAELAKDKHGLALLKVIAGHFEEFPTTFVNPLYILHRSHPDGFMPQSSGDSLRVALAGLLPFKLAGGADNKTKRGKPKKDDHLNRTLQIFVRGVCCHAVPDSLAINQRILTARGGPGAWAKEFVLWVKRSCPDEVERPDGVFHQIASNRLEVKQRSQLRNKNGRSYDGDNLWPQFQQVVTRRLGSILSR